MFRLVRFRSREQIVQRQDLPAAVPVLGNADFGHTNPSATVPVGGRITMTAGPSSTITITAH